MGIIRQFNNAICSASNSSMRFLPSGPSCSVRLRDRPAILCCSLALVANGPATEGEWVATSYVMNGTQLGSWIGIRPIGRTIEVRGVNIDRVVDSKITEHESSTDLLDPLLENNHHSIHWIKDYLQNKFVTKNKDVETLCETEAA